MIEAGLTMAGLWFLVFRKLPADTIRMHVFNSASRLLWIWDGWARCVFCFSLSVLTAAHLMRLEISPEILGQAFAAYLVIVISDAAACIVKAYLHVNDQD